MRKVEKRKSVTLEECQKEVRKLGHKNSACDWEDEYNIFAFSFKSVPETFGHPVVTVCYVKETKDFVISHA